MPRRLSRALRRHHRLRLKRRRAGYWNGATTTSPRHAGKCLRSPASCSCWLCGNRRKHHGPTFQERRENQEPFDA